ncbi:MAG: Zn-dependent protease [Bradymonadia bacterium]|jgi:Zn-dependent protease
MYSAQSPSKRLFKLFGFPVEAELNSLFMVVIVMMFYGKGGPDQIVFAALLCVAIFLSIVAHELGHALMTRRLGYGGSTIRLTLAGGVAISRGRRSARDSIKISLAGPAVTALIAVVGIVVSVVAPSTPRASIVGQLLFYTTALNVMWAVFNMLPIYPMDGGQALRAWLSTKLPARETLKRSLIVSGAIAALLIVAAIAWQQYLLLLIVGWMALKNWQEWTRNFA